MYGVTNRRVSNNVMGVESLQHSMNESKLRTGRELNPGLYRGKVL